MMRPLNQLQQICTAKDVGAFFADVCNCAADEYESDESAEANREWLKPRIPRSNSRAEWRRFLLDVAKKAVEVLEPVVS